MRLKQRLKKYLLGLQRDEVPALPLAFLPDGLSVHKVADTGIVVVDNFCTAEEAEYLIAKAQPVLSPSRILVKNATGENSISDHRTSCSATILTKDDQDPEILRLVARAAMFTGLDGRNVDPIYVNRYREGNYYNVHNDYLEDGFPLVDRVYSTLIYLNDLGGGQGGGTHFAGLNLEVRPKMGRAVFWTNANPDGSYHREYAHAGLPVSGAETEKWVANIFFRAYNVQKSSFKPLQAPQLQVGEPLKGGETLPAGALVNTDSFR